MTPEKMPDSSHIATIVIQERSAVGLHREHVTPIYMTSGFRFPDAETARAVFVGEQPGYVYSRWENPNTDELVQRVCALEGAETGIATASGMAAIFTVLGGLLNSGDHVLASRSLYSATHQLLASTFPRWGIGHTYAELERMETWPDLFRPETRLCLVETPSNPALTLIDLAWLAELCRQKGVLLVVDNTFATPIVQRPVDLGADIVIHSATKFLDGQGRIIGGVVVGDQFTMQELTQFARQTGPALSPMNAWLVSQSLETLDMRMERHCANALALATWLEKQPHVEAVSYPFLPSHPQYELARRQMTAGGGLLTLEIAGGLDAGRRFLNSLRMCHIVSNLGDARTMATHPASTTHSTLTAEEQLAAGITPGLIRISVGLEHIDDIISDIAQAL